jgi:hypothetical protein
MFDKLAVSLGLKYLASKLDGYKSYVGATGKALSGIVLIITGVIGLIGHFWPDLGFPAMDEETACGTIVAGWYMIASGLSTAGIKSAIQKTQTSPQEENK